MKRLGVLTSGGDCAGLNAALRAIVHAATHAGGFEIVGIHDGTTGLIRRPLSYTILTPDQCNRQLLCLGGTFLGSTNNADPFHFPVDNGYFKDCSNDLIQGYHDLNLNALIVIGGDGSLKIMLKLAEMGKLNLIAIPKTIDNDIAHTELCIGFSTALDAATQAVDRLATTAFSHHRIMILEVMGRDAGHIALSAGIAGGADAILIPEIPYCLKDLAQHLKTIQQSGRKDSIVVVSEAVLTEDSKTVVVDSCPDTRVRYGGISHYIANRLTKNFGLETRATVLGHLQRGGSPNAMDRALASAFGVHAIDLVLQEKFNRMVAWNNKTVTDISIGDAIQHYHCVSKDDILVKTAKRLGIYVGHHP